MTVITVTASGAIAAPPERLWELVSDTARYAEWVVGTAKVSRPAGQAALGTTYEEINPIAGPWRAKTRWSVIEFDPPRRQVHRSEDIPIASEFLVTIEIEPSAHDSEITVTLQATSSLGVLGAALCRLLEPQTRRDNERTVRNLAELAAHEL
jgi:uncharacterized protein YndB with AHSA1/START domain